MARRGDRAVSELGVKVLFLRKFLREGRKVASVWPSSRALAEATIGEVDFGRARVIVELGAGTGPITAAVVERLRAETWFVVLERDADFVRVLRRRFGGRRNVEIVAGDARDLGGILEARGIAEVDCVLCGLPTPSLPAETRGRMFGAVRKYLAAGGVFSAVTEIPWLYWAWYRRFFRRVRFRFVPANLPPSGVYHCWGPKEAGRGVSGVQWPVASFQWPEGGGSSINEFR